ncbi:hypothetical protein ACKGJO_06585 [Gracilimonas sp. Q87]|uniref:hypothetical protein n=1 Tax=Gracilimonas sp. Q87 TaxID=3384766 RepID=UPI003983E8F8
MDVYFASKNPNQNRIGPLLVNGVKISFHRGSYKTTDKNEIAGLLSHPFYKRGRYELVSDPEKVSQYLENDEEPDYIDKDYIDKVSNDAIKEIGEVVGTKNTFPALIKSELVGEPITSAIEKIVVADIGEAEAYGKDTSDEDTSKEADSDEDTSKNTVKKKTATKKKKSSSKSKK